MTRGHKPKNQDVGVQNAIRATYHPLPATRHHHQALGNIADVLETYALAAHRQGCTVRGGYRTVCESWSGWCDYFESWW